jgi:hypothetical protein
MRTRPCDKVIRLGRLRKATQFKKAADLIHDLTEGGDVRDTYVALCVLAGIAASDVICCAGLAEYPKGDNHTEATGLLRKVDNVAARHLSTLLGMKTKTEYSHSIVTVDEAKKAGRAAEALLDKAHRAHAAAGGAQ